jgi:intraflagellar transport protein 172
MAGGGGDTASGGDAELDSLAAKGQWDDVFSKAATKPGGPEVVARYAGVRAAALLKDNKVAESVRVLKTRGAPTGAAHHNTYRLLTRKIFGSPKLLQQSSVVQDLRAVLYSVTDALRTGNGDTTVLGEFTAALRVAHLLSQKAICTKHGLKELAARAALSALRHVNVLPADWAFYEAGELCRGVNWLSAAFVTLNRFLDLSEAMEDDDGGGVGMIENADFADTDIPFDFELPDQPSVSDGDRERVRDWILAVSVDDAVDQNLPTRVCSRCGEPTYEGALVCHSCGDGDATAPCIVSGFPVLPSQLVRCTSCDSRANGPDFNRFVASMRVCPWCNAAQSPQH